MCLPWETVFSSSSEHRNHSSRDREVGLAVLLEGYMQSRDSISCRATSAMNAQKSSDIASQPPVPRGLLPVSNITLKSPSNTNGSPWNSDPTSVSYPQNNALTLEFTRL